VVLRFAPGARWPLLLGAVRDEFVDRPWDAPAAHWPQTPHLFGGRDQVAGGTWLAVDRSRPAVAAVLNGMPLPPPAGGWPHSRGRLPLAALSGADAFGPAGPAGYDAFHLLRATLDDVQVWSWDGSDLVHRRLPPGDHIVVNAGIDTDDDPLVPHFMPLLQHTSDPDPERGLPTKVAWTDWVDLLAGDDLELTDPRALIVSHTYAGRTYGSTSASLVGLRPAEARYDFSPRPTQPDAWYEVPLS
jgi:hypothetical protein